MAETKVILGITINTKPELNLELIAQGGGIPQERDDAVEQWEANPLEQNLETLEKVMEYMRPFQEKMNKELMDELREDALRRNE